MTHVIPHLGISLRSFVYKMSRILLPNINQHVLPSMFSFEMGSCGAGVASASVTRFFLKPSALPRALSHPRLLHFPFEHHQRLQFRSKGQILVHNADKTFYYSQKEEEEIHATGGELTFLEQESRTCLQRLKESLVLIDLIQRLGIDYKFTEHIEKILETAFIKWDKEYGLGDVETTVLAFRLLRIRGYHVSTEVLRRLKDDNNKFSSFTIETPTGIRCMLNLYKCSQVQFSSESDVMGDIIEFASSQLKIALSVDEQFLRINNLLLEVKFAINYPRRYLLPKLESRNIIRELWPSNGRNNKYLELAKEDLDSLQKQYKQEIYMVERWWKEIAVEVLPFNRGNTLKSFFLVSATMFEPRFSTYRVAFTKNATLIILMDDLFDYPASDYEGLFRFIEAVRRWDPSLLNDLPEHELVFAAVQSTVEDIATVSSKEQGRDLLPYFKTLWEDIVSWYSKEAEWKKGQYFPTLEEYLENGRCSIGVITCYCTSMFLLGDPITDEIIHHVGGGSRLLRLVGLVSRVANDIVTYQREVLRGETVSSVSCYMRDNLGCSEEEAIYSLSQMMENAWHEIEWELFSCRNVVPESCHHAMLSLARMYAFSYKSIDAFTENSDTEFEFHYQDYLYGSLG